MAWLLPLTYNYCCVFLVVVALTKDVYSNTDQMKGLSIELVMI